MTPDNDSAARRAYWAEQMQAGYDLIQQVLPFEIAECHAAFASNVDAAAAAAGTIFDSGQTPHAQ